MLEPITVSNVLRLNITCFVLTLYDFSHCVIVHFPIYLDHMGKLSKRRPGERLSYYRGWFRLSHSKDLGCITRLAS
jgi:hypothetical protein